MKTSVLFAALALALPAFATPSASPTPTPSEPRNPCEVKYNHCLDTGSAEVICNCDRIACYGEDAARIRDWCDTQTSGLPRGTGVPRPVPTPNTCVNKYNVCRSNDPVTGASANQAQCSSENTACISDCYDAYNRCRVGGSSPDRPLCASDYAACLGENPFASNGTLVIKPDDLTPANATRSGVFGGLAYRVSSAIHYLPINASSSAFYINRDTSVYCPNVQDIHCSNTTDTQFIAGATNGTLSLYTQVTGGQQVFVANDGRLSFNSPHSGNSTVNSTFTGFSFTQNGLYVQFQNSGFLACPIDASWIIFAASIKKESADDCLSFDFRTFNATLPAAYQYA